MYVGCYHSGSHVNCDAGCVGTRMQVLFLVCLCYFMMHK